MGRQYRRYTEEFKRDALEVWRVIVQVRGDGAGRDEAGS
jgi:hypothetical protein